MRRSDRLRALVDPALDPYARGLLDGIARFAWMKDGTTYVGTTGWTLEQAFESVLRERAYDVSSVGSEP